jgi:hypothetical protein
MCRWHGCPCDAAHQRTAKPLTDQETQRRRLAAAAGAWRARALDSDEGGAGPGREIADDSGGQ